MSEKMNLGRVGHYHAPNTTLSTQEPEATPCLSAEIVRVWNDTLVNLAGHDENGNCFARTSIKVASPASGEWTFHLNRDCPWER